MKATDALTAIRLAKNAEKAAEGLLKRSKRVAVVTDAIKEIDAAKGECSLRDFQAQGARLTTAAEITQRLTDKSRRLA